MEESKMNEENNKPKIVMGLDISTTCIGVCVLEENNTDYGNVLELTHISPKVPKKIKGIESLFIKKQIFKDEFLHKWKDFGISRVIIESPLLSSNNVNTVATLLQFNGMISDSIYNMLGVVPEYISSYDARKYSFPSLMAIRKHNKKGEIYEKNKIINSIKKNNLTLFGAYAWDIDKKQIIWDNVSKIFSNIEWLYDKKGELKKENFDATDAYVACLGYLNHEKYGDLNEKISNFTVTDDLITYHVEYWDRKEDKQIFLK